MLTIDILVQKAINIFWRQKDYWHLVDKWRSFFL